MSVSVPRKSHISAVEPFIGQTPLLPVESEGAAVSAKTEWQQLGGSVKSRPSFRIIKDAIDHGHLTGGKRLLDATSGNTGIAYATIMNRLGLPLTLFVPENASVERKNMFRALGVDIRYTSGQESTEGARAEAQQLAERYPDRYFYADQYSNPSNWKAHYETTADEIWKQTEGQITHFVAGLGTTGTFTGTGRRLKELNPDIQLIALQPDTALHGLEGWKHLESADVPLIFDHRLADRTITVSTEDAYAAIREFALSDGIILSPSSAANLIGSRRIAAELTGGHVVTVFPDDHTKYSSVITNIL